MTAPNTITSAAVRGTVVLALIRANAASMRAVLLARNSTTPRTGKSISDMGLGVSDKASERVQFDSEVIPALIYRTLRNQENVFGVRDSLQLGKNERFLFLMLLADVEFFQLVNNSRFGSGSLNSPTHFYPSYPNDKTRPAHAGRVESSERVSGRVVKSQVNCATLLRL